LDDRAENLNYLWDGEKNQSRKRKTTASARTRGKSTVGEYTVGESTVGESTVGESVDQVTPRRDYTHNSFYRGHTFVSVCTIGWLSLTVNTSIYYVLSEERTATCFEHFRSLQS